MAKDNPSHLPFGRAIRLQDYDPSYDAGMKESEARALTTELQRELRELQEMLYAQGKYAVLVVLQAMDGGGKDGTIENIFTGINPQGVRVTSFKVPTSDELARDFLWRVHLAVPPKGQIGIFNRSHYEDVLVVRVNQLVPEAVWRARYDHINNFEKLLADNGTLILKFYLHISREEQKKRFLSRIQEPHKRWKFSKGDLAVRERWEDYMRAYEDVFTECHHPHAAWHVVPANKKWYRDYVVMSTIVNAMKGLPLAYPQPEEGLDDIIIPD
jgi:PPK2 family polyphosphate:nucleotide phosphotransferase